MSILICIIGENRNFVKEVCDAFGRYDNAEFDFELVFYSVFALDRIVQKRPDIVIADVKMLLNVSTFLTELSKFNWNFATFLFGDGNVRGNFGIEFYMYSYREVDFAVKKIVKKEFNLVSKNDEKTLYEYKKQNYELIVENNLYFCVFAKYNGLETDFVTSKLVSKFKKAISNLPSPITFQILNADILFVIEMKKGSSNKGLVEITKSIHENFSRNYSVFYEDNINFFDLNNAIYKLIHNLHFSYFTNGMSIKINEVLKNKKNKNVHDVYGDFSVLLKNVLNCKKIEMEATLMELFIIDVMQNYDIFALNLLRDWLNIWTDFFGEITKIYFDKSKKFYTVEEEHFAYDEYFNKVVLYFKENELNGYVKKTLLYTLDSFKDSSLSLDSMANRLSITKMHLSRVFKESTNLTYLVFLHKIRLYNAKVYVLGSDMKIKDVTKQCGYDDPHYFTKVFKKEYQITPRQYREIERKNCYESLIFCR
ncbi:MAG: helix-turn-helix transcriptional regulator [Lachnospirales bacterium]